MNEEKYVERSQKLFAAAQSVNYTRWHSRSLEGFQFSLGIQMSDANLKKRRKKGMPTFIINMTTPIKEMIKYFTTASDPEWVAIPFEASDTAIAEMHNSVNEHCWYISHGKSVFSRIIDDALTKGLGWWHINVDANLDRGSGEVIYGNENPWTVFVDPTAKDILYRDANWMLIKDDLPRGTLLGMHAGDEAKIRAASGSTSLYENYFNYMGIDSQLWEIGNSENPVTEVTPEKLAYNIEGEEDDILPYFRLYTKEREKFAHVFMIKPPNDAEAKRIAAVAKEKIDANNKELTVKHEEEQIKLDQMKEVGIKEGGITENRHALESEKLAKVVRMARDKFASNLTSQLIQAATTEIHEIFNEKEHKAFLRKKSLQKFVTDTTFYFEDVIKLTITCGDKHLSTKIMPSRHFPLIPIQYIYTGNTFPMSLVELLVGKQKELNVAHQIMIHNANLGSNLRWLYRKGSIDVKQWEDYAASAGALLPINPGQDFPKEVTPLPLSNAFLGITEKGSSDMEYLAGVFRGSMGDAAAMHDTAKGQKTADQFGTRRTRQWVDNIIDPALEQLGIVFKDYAQALYKKHKVATFVGPNNVRRNLEINVPQYDGAGKVVEYWSDYKSSAFDVKIKAGSTLPKNQEEKFQKMLMLAKEGIVDDIAVINESPDIKDKEGLIERKSKLSNALREVESLQKSNKKLEGDNQSLESMIVSSRLQVQVADAGTKINKEVVESKSRISAGETKAIQEVKGMVTNLSLRLENMLKESELAIKEEKIDKKAKTSTAKSKPKPTKKKQDN